MVACCVANNPSVLNVLTNLIHHMFSYLIFIDFLFSLSSIQVHNRTLELTLLIESLRRVKGIEKALVIFSHDFYSDEMNNLIASIRFTRTVQIFYPHSTQIFPNSFPGTDPRDCESRLSPDK
ncbi:unnamed protein product [Trichobilharzia regenti]|nr:unnamed protein product [Trichobilharzia regenti]